MDTHAFRSPSLTILSILMLMTASDTALAAEGRTPIPFKLMNGQVPLPIVISEPGSYVLTTDLSVPDGSPSSVLEITAPGNVQVDLNGLTLEGVGGPDAVHDTVSISPGPTGTIALRNGFIEGGRDGVRAVAGALELEGLVIRNTARDGVRLQGSAFSGRALIRGCELTATGGRGMYLEFFTGNESPGPEQGFPTLVIEDNVVTATGEHGMYVTWARNGGRIVDNAITDTGTAPGNRNGGLILNDSDRILVARNVIDGGGNGRGLSVGSDGTPLTVKSHHRVEDNTFTKCATGVWVNSGGNIVRDNKIADTTLDCMETADQADFNVFEGNFMEGCGRWGLVFDAGASDNTYRNNTAVNCGGTEGNCPDPNERRGAEFCNMGVDNHAALGNMMPPASGPF